MSGDTWQAMCLFACLYKTHDKPCVHLHVFTRHMASHVSTCMEGASRINRSVRRRSGEEERKREREERRERERRKTEEERNTKKKENKKKKRKEVDGFFLSSLVFRQ